MPSEGRASRVTVCVCGGGWIPQSVIGLSAVSWVSYTYELGAWPLSYLGILLRN